MSVGFSRVQEGAVGCAMSRQVYGAGRQLPIWAGSGSCAACLFLEVDGAARNDGVSERRGRRLGDTKQGKSSGTGEKSDGVAESQRVRRLRSFRGQDVVQTKRMRRGDGRQWATRWKRAVDILESSLFASSASWQTWKWTRRRWRQKCLGVVLG